MKTYKIITLSQKLTMNMNELSKLVENIINEKCNAGWELIDISWCGYSTGLGGTTAILTFRY
jgi:hypothetical protein